jgi:hypothetical protein
MGFCVFFALLLLGGSAQAVQLPVPLARSRLVGAAVGCGTASAVRLCHDVFGCCSTVGFGNCSTGTAVLEFTPSAQCDGALNGGLMLGANESGHAAQTCAAQVGPRSWYTWLGVSEYGTQAGMSATCADPPPPCSTTQICDSNHGCCTVQGFGSCTIGMFTLAFTLDASCDAVSGAALGLSNPWNNATTCALLANANSWFAWWDLPNVDSGWQDQMNATCLD